MVSKDVVERINYYARKEKSVGLTKEEKNQRDLLRKQYLKEFKANFKNKLDNIEFEDEKSEQN